MTVPLAPFLTRFSAPPPLLLAIEAAEPPPAVVSLTQDEFDARLEAARRGADVQAAERYAAEAAAVAQAHWAQMDQALATARAEWSAAESDRLAALFDAAVAELEARLSERIAAVLQPWLTATVRDRARQELTSALDRLLADGITRCIKVSGPDDLVTTMRDARPNAAIEWQVTDAVDVTIVADMTRIETRLAAALPDLVTEG